MDEPFPICCNGVIRYVFCLMQARAQLHSLDRAEGLSLRPANGPDAPARWQPLLATEGS